MATKQKKNGKKKLKYSAGSADKFILYEKAVQNPEADVDFLTAAFKKKRGRTPLTLREDFCGTAALCAAWVKRRPKRSALGLDLDTATLNWGSANNIAPLGKAATRVRLMERNVLERTREKSDIVCAFNFSYCIFKQRMHLLNYFKAAFEGVKRGGAFFIDVHGGSELGDIGVESQDFDGFTYVWEQQPLCAVTNEGFRHIHFHFPDGTEMNEAFTYDWRFWTLPEVKEILLEAGFKDVDIYWEGATEEGDGDGKFVPVNNAEQEASWIAYVGAWR